MKEQGARGEDLVRFGLADLPSSYRCFHNLVVRVANWHNRTTQIDHVVTSPFGLFVIETKLMQGVIVGGEEAPVWQQHLGRCVFRFGNPLRQSRGHVAALAEQLDLPWEVFRPVVVFAERARLAKPHTNVITTIAPEVPGLHRYI